MTSEEKFKRLSPSHHHFEQVLDPWHVDAFEEQIVDWNGLHVVNVGQQDAIPYRGVRRKVWYSVDWCGNLIQEWGEDTPSGE